MPLFKRLCRRLLLTPFTETPQVCRIAQRFYSSPQIFGPKSSVNSFCLRTHHCGQLRLENVGERVELYGWLAQKRLGKFLVLRDSYGRVQATVPDDKLEEFRGLMSDLRKESVIKVKGIVSDRGKDRNKDMPTGDIEVVIENMEMLNTCVDSSPVARHRGQEGSPEMNRMTYRYMDLRTEQMQYNLRMRSQIQSQIRRFLESVDFVEVETPTLSQITPGGAAEFIVPAPKPNLGLCFSLPQSPQIYKQLLMCGGIDRYYQFARCYRDERLNQERQSEFTQVDLELSFTDQESVISLIENMILESWPQQLRDYKPTVPFNRMTYAKSMEKYGTDKPDLRKSKKDENDFQFVWIVNFPLFTFKDGAIESTHHPFTAPIHEDLDDLINSRNLKDITGLHYDLVLNGVELGGGSIRIHDSKLQRHVLENILRIDSEPMKRFLSALEHGAPPHGGFALGFDRYISTILGSKCPSIRDCIAFPKTATNRCLTMGAPNTPTPEIYQRYGLQPTADKEQTKRILDC
ncbi:tRNA synthetases class II (D, K and n) domain-containing protein [Ditylenchus destructor]|nr:tRNA synthetases class II (D, K and n) domain-containing protein [Ditylenchus destructor]